MTSLFQKERSLYLDNLSCCLCNSEEFELLE